MKTRNFYQKKKEKDSVRCSDDDVACESKISDLQAPEEKKTSTSRSPGRPRKNRKVTLRKKTGKLKSTKSPDVRIHPLVANPLTRDGKSFMLPSDVQGTYIDLFNTSMIMSFDFKQRGDVAKADEQTLPSEAGTVVRKSRVTKPLKKTRKRLLAPTREQDVVDDISYKFTDFNSPSPDKYLQENVQEASLRSRRARSSVVKRRKILFSEITKEDDRRLPDSYKESEDSDSSDEVEEWNPPNKIRKRHKLDESNKVQKTSSFDLNKREKKRRKKNHKKNPAVPRSLSKIIQKIKNRFQSDNKIQEANNDLVERLCEKYSEDNQDTVKDQSKSCEDLRNNLHLMSGSDKNELVAADPLVILHPVEDQINQKNFEKLTTFQSTPPSKSHLAPTKSSPTLTSQEKLIHPRYAKVLKDRMTKSSSQVVTFRERLRPNSPNCHKANSRGGGSSLEEMANSSHSPAMKQFAHALKIKQDSPSSSNHKEDFSTPTSRTLEKDKLQTPKSILKFPGKVTPFKVLSWDPHIQFCKPRKLNFKVDSSTNNLSNHSSDESKTSQSSSTDPSPLPLVEDVKSQSETTSNDLDLIQPSSTNSTTEKTTPKLPPASDDEESIRVYFSVRMSKDLIKKAKDLGMIICSSVKDNCTHMVIDHIIRSYETLSACLLGLKIIKPTWIELSSKNAGLLPSSHFQFSGSDPDVEHLEKKFHFNLLKTLAKSRKRSQLLYSGMTFYVCPNVKYGANLISSLIKIGGGEVVDSCPTNSYSKKLVRVITTSDPKSDSTRSNIIKSTPNVRILSSEYIFNGILKNATDDDVYKLR